MLASLPRSPTDQVVRPNRRRPRRWLGRLWFIVAMAFGFGSIVAYWVVASIVNAEPPTPRFQGWVAVLQPTVAALTPGDQVKLIVLPGLPGVPGPHPELSYAVVVCGDHPFDGILVAGGDARLTNVRVVAADNRGTTGAGAASTPSVEAVPDLTMAQGTVFHLGPVQVLRLTYTWVPPCAAPASAQTQPPFPAFGGAAELESGLAMAPVRRDSQVLWWIGPRSSQYWPLIGVLPGFPPGDAGAFTGVQGLSGLWSRPVPEYVEVEAGGLAARASLDEVQPQPVSTTGLDWQGVPPMEPTARVTDVDAMSAWQQRLVVAGIALGIGGSLLASWLFELGRRALFARSSGPEPSPTLPGATVRRRRPHPSLVLLLLAAVLMVRSRGRRRVHRQ
jgi:hypothetical protein